MLSHINLKNGHGNVCKIVTQFTYPSEYNLPFPWQKGEEVRLVGWITYILQFVDLQNCASSQLPSASLTSSTFNKVINSMRTKILVLLCYSFIPVIESFTMSLPSIDYVDIELC
jgi:hypothetical protein